MQNDVELLKFKRLIATYELLTELHMSSIRYSAHSIWIDWSYPDGTWAGTTSCDSPLCKVIEKLERETIVLQQSIITPDAEYTISSC